MERGRDEHHVPHDRYETSQCSGIQRVTTKLAAAGAVMALGIGTFFPAPAIAQTSPGEDWQFGAIVYGYFPSIGGC